jgi:hypothetical protein
MRKNISKLSLISGIAISALLFLQTYRHFNDVLERDHQIITLLTVLFAVAGILVFSFWTLKETKGIHERIRTLLIFFLVPLAGEACIELLNTNVLWDIDLFGNIVMNYGINLMVILILYALTGSPKLSGKISLVIYLCFGIINMYVKMYKGSPFVPWDLTVLETAGSVAGGYSYSWNLELIASLALTVFFWKLCSCMAKEKPDKKKIIRRAYAFGVPALVLGIFYGTDLIAERFGATPDFFNQTRGYEAKGAAAEFLVNTRYMKLSEPKPYEADTLETRLQDVLSDSPKTITETALGEKPEITVTDPDIIVVMNESFSDLSVTGDFKTNQAYMPFIDSLKNDPNTIEGNSYVSTIGTGTSNTEYEFLTGNSMAFLPYGSNAYQLYVREEQASLVSALKDQGYGADVFHPYYKDDWNRPQVYKDMGFNSFTAMEDMDSYEKLRGFISDACDFNWVMNDMNTERDKPEFLFNITMQNHSSYEKPWSNFDQEITLEGMEGDYPSTEQYLSLVKVTDEEFERLVEYVDHRTKPTILLMFGDHQPFIEDAFYEEVMGKKITELSDEENQKRYITRFILHANYDIPSGWIDAISVNYLSTLLAENTGTELTPYQKFSQAMYAKMPVVTALGCLDTEGNYFQADEETPYTADLNLWRELAYNNLQDRTSLQKDLFWIPEKKE